MQVLKGASVKRSLAAIALDDGFDANPDGARGLRIGIDASIWIVHATNWVANSKDGRDVGENPELRTILFKCTKLMQLPFLPLFVFDGPLRPRVKRGKVITRTPHWIVAATQDILKALGIEFRTVRSQASPPKLSTDNWSGPRRGRGRACLFQPNWCCRLRPH